jgi:hypothetical protein
MRIHNTGCPSGKKQVKIGSYFIFLVNSGGSLEEKSGESPSRPATAAAHRVAPISLDAISFSRGRLAPDTNHAETPASDQHKMPEPSGGGGARRKTNQPPPQGELPPGLHLGRKKAAQSQQRALLNLPPEQLQGLASGGINSIPLVRLTPISNQDIDNFISKGGHVYRFNPFCFMNVFKKSKLTVD